MLGIVPFDRNTLDASLDNGEIDLGIGVPGPVPKRQAIQKLFHESFVCITRKNHPGIRGELDIGTFLERPHALVSQRGDGVGIVDDALAERGLRRKVTVSTTSFTGLPFLIAQTDLIAVTPNRIANHVAVRTGLDIHPVPIDLAGFDLTMVWGSGKTASPQHVWFRKLVTEIISDRN